MDANSERDFEDVDPFSVAVESYCDCVKDALMKRWRSAGFEPYNTEKYEVVFGLLSRQATLSIELTLSPSVWNGHIAPLILRTMTEVYITLRWILEDIEARSLMYIDYGLGQEKLSIEHLKEKTKNHPDKDMDDYVKAREEWLNAEKAMYLTDINLGSWSGKNTRDMAKESGCEDLYKFAYTGFSAVVHSTWTHIARYNLEFCKNPIHKYHRVPIISRLAPDADYPYRAAKYVEKSFRAVDEKFELSVNAFDVRDFFDSVMASLSNEG